MNAISQLPVDRMRSASIWSTAQQAVYLNSRRHGLSIIAAHQIARLCGALLLVGKSEAISVSKCLDLIDKIRRESPADNADVATVTQCPRVSPRTMTSAERALIANYRRSSADARENARAILEQSANAIYWRAA